MATLFRRHTGVVSCFFCQSLITPSPRNPASFLCPHCKCWNRYDAQGEIMSDDPAMHDESLNKRAFAKRASASKDRLPTINSKDEQIICRTCQTNQMLLVNLLSNYLPPPESPEYERRLSLLSSYRESLHARYPPLCDSCTPLVEEEIKKKDEMARTKALGGWLKGSRGKDKERQEKLRGKKAVTRGKVTVELWGWRVRGVLWMLSLVLAVWGNTAASMGWRPPSQFSFLQPFLPVPALLSILWTVWDPTYASFRHAQLQGRDIRVVGKQKYITFQLVAWGSRLLTSVVLCLAAIWPNLDYLELSMQPRSRSCRVYFTACLILELGTFISSCTVLRLSRPPAIRLINTQTRNTPEPTSLSDRTRAASAPPLQTITGPELLAALSLSSKPVLPSNPIFGLPSMSLLTKPDNPTNDAMDEDEDENAMDWTPTNPSPKKSPFHLKNSGKSKAKEAEDDGSWLRPQRFFPPEKPTGLESLLERTALFDEPDLSTRRPIPTRSWKSWLFIITVTVTPLLGAIALFMWRRRFDGYAVYMDDPEFEAYIDWL